MKRLLIATMTGSLFLWGGAALAGDVDGSKVFAKKCASCHGKDGKGDTAAGKKAGVKDFAGSKLSDADLEKTVTEGIQDAAGKFKSPAFKDKLTPDEIKAVAAHVKTFRK